ncbi:hypothetical protein E2C01_035717 [Portunus trituberculatus]|uniref:Uncharacterized protein n=1 Tax=Portunus trituberculatus TaxID=210409 RepID=A0A5B7F6N2_PORTR|nr:hypothetical protein [Portunus trituberculatus]
MTKKSTEKKKKKKETGSFALTIGMCHVSTLAPSCTLSTNRHTTLAPSCILSTNHCTFSTNHHHTPDPLVLRPALPCLALPSAFPTETIL